MQNSSEINKINKETDNSHKVKAVCLMNVKKGKLNKVIDILKSIPQVEKITSVTGDADIIAHLEVNYADEFHDIYANIIDQIDGVLQTKTYVVMREYHMH